MAIKDYIIFMQQYIRQAVKAPYSANFTLSDNKYTININGFNADFDISMIEEMATVMSPYLTAKQLLESWQTRYIHSIININAIKLV